MTARPHRRPPTALATGAAALFLALAAAGCGGDGDDAGATTSAPTEATTGAPDRPTDREDCAWSVRADEETLNIAYPDTAATYWAIAYDLAPGERLELSGRLPDARYASFISYGPNGGPIDVATDHDLALDDGRYTVTVHADGDPDAARPDVLEARTSEPVEARVVDAPPGIRLGTGSGEDAVAGTTLYRVYLPEPADDPTGGQGLPEVTLVSGDGERTAIAPCPDPGASERAVALVEAYGPETDAATPDAPTFIRPASDAATLFPNPDNIYIATILEHEPGRIVVIRGKAPEVGEQLRYWSLCTDEYEKPYRVSSCVVDEDVAVADDGTYTFVISTPEDRPANAEAAAGVTWLDWGDTTKRNLVLLRHMLPDPDFDEAATNVEPLGLATDTMGDYAPIGAFCTTTAFEADPASCPTPAP